MESILKAGTVSSVDKEKGLVSVQYEHWDEDTTEMIPYLKHRIIKHDCPTCRSCPSYEDCRERRHWPELPRVGDRVVTGSLKGGGSAVLGILKRVP